MLIYFSCRIGAFYSIFAYNRSQSCGRTKIDTRWTRPSHHLTAIGKVRWGGAASQRLFIQLVRNVKNTQKSKSNPDFQIWFIRIRCQLIEQE